MQQHVADMTAHIGAHNFVHDAVNVNSE